METIEYLLRTRLGMTFRSSDAQLEKTLLFLENDVPVFSVHSSQSAEFTAFLESAEHFVVTDHEHVLVSHEEFEAVNA